MSLGEVSCMRFVKNILFLGCMWTPVIQAEGFNDLVNEKLAMINIFVKKIGAEELAEYRRTFGEIRDLEARSHTNIDHRGFEEYFTLINQHHAQQIPFSATNRQRLEQLRDRIYNKWLNEVGVEKRILTDGALTFAIHNLSASAQGILVRDNQRNTDRAALHVKIAFGVFAGIVIVSGVVAKVMKVKKSKKVVKIA